MRPIAFGLAALCALAMTAGTAAAAPAMLPAPASGPAITLVAGGCGPGFHPRSWIDPYGRPRVACEPNRVVPVRRCAPGWHWREWRGPYGRLHSECVPNR